VNERLSRLLKLFEEQEECQGPGYSRIHEEILKVCNEISHEERGKASRDQIYAFAETFFSTLVKIAFSTDPLDLHWIHDFITLVSST